MEDQFHSTAGEALSLQLPNFNDYGYPIKNTPKSTLFKPAYFRYWEGFRPMMREVFERVKNRRVTRLDNYLRIFNPADGILILNCVKSLLLECGELQGATYKTNNNIRRSRGGFPDHTIYMAGVELCIGEFKRQPVDFDPQIPPWEQDPSLNNSFVNTTLQMYSYLITKGNLVYGFWTNCTQWIFMRRVHGPNGEEVLELTEFFDQNEAFQAIAGLFVTIHAAAVQAAEEKAQPSQNNVEQLEVCENPPLPRSPLADVTLPPGTGISGGLMQQDPEEQNGFFSLATCVSEFQFTTTKQELGIENLSVCAIRDSEIISWWDMDRTFRYRANGKDLTWRQWDLYGIPRCCPRDLGLSDFERMITREIGAYMHLRSHWDRLIPRFLYFGHDCTSLWVIVTSYEGISLRDMVREKGGLGQDVKDKARQSLQQLHSLGVIHGDVQLTSVVYREEDGCLLWIDFGFSTVISNITSKEAIRLAQEELVAFEQELATVPTVPVAS